MYHYTNRTKQVISVVAIALFFSITTLKLDQVEANPITAPECRDVPSCIVIGTVIIGGVVYYLIKNTVTGVVHRVSALHVPPAHRANQNSHEEIFEGLVSSEEECKRKALIYGERVGGLWTHRMEDAGISSPEGSPVPSGRRFKCFVKKVG